MTNLPKFVQEVKGHFYIRYRGQRAALAGQPGTATFEASYQRELARLQTLVAASEAKHALKPKTKKGRVAGAGTGTLDAVKQDYFQTDKYKSAPHNTQRNQRYNLDKLTEFAEDGDRLGDVLFVDLQRRHIRKLLSRMSGAQARPWLSAVRALVLHATTMELLKADGKVFDEDDDPTLGIKPPPRGKRDGASGGFQPWDDKMVAMYRDAYPLGTEARLTLEVFRYTGAAATDAAQLGWHNVVEDDEMGWAVVYERDKTGVRGVNALWTELQEALAASGRGRDWVGPWLQGADGMPTTAHNLSERFRRWAMLAGVPAGHTAHGVRKFYVTELAEHGATTSQLRSAGAWSTDEEPGYYTRGADRVKGARGLFRLMAGVRPVGQPSRKKGKKAA